MYKFLSIIRCRIQLSEWMRVVKMYKWITKRLDAEDYAKETTKFTTVLRANNSIPISVIYRVYSQKRLLTTNFLITLLIIPSQNVWPYDISNGPLFIWQHRLIIALEEHCCVSNGTNTKMNDIIIIAQQRDTLGVRDNVAKSKAKRI